MAYQSNITPWYGGAVLAGNCLVMSQLITGAPVMHPSATDAANATQYRHYDRNLPDAPAVLWFSHWGAYGYPGQEVWKDWGHVVVWDPATGMLASSSPRAGYFEGPWFYGSIAAVEAAFACSFRFWSEDINYKRVCQPAAAPAPTPPPPTWEELLKPFLSVVKRSTDQGITANRPTRVKFNDKGDVSFAFGATDIVGGYASPRVRGKKGGRVEFSIVREVEENKKITKSVRVTRARATIDSLGLAQVSLAFGGKLASNERLRVLIHSNVLVHVESCEAGGWKK